MERTSYENLFNLSPNCPQQCTSVCNDLFTSLYAVPAADHIPYFGTTSQVFAHLSIMKTSYTESVF
jgi:hypothetical protein